MLAMEGVRLNGFIDAEPELSWRNMISNLGLELS